MRFGLLALLVVASSACGARSSLRPGDEQLDGQGGSGGSAVDTASTAAPSAVTASSVTASSASSTQASSSTGTPDPQLCTTLAWSGELVFVDTTHIYGRPALVPTADGRVAFVYSTGSYVSSITFDGWGSWPPALAEPVDHLERELVSGQPAIIARPDGSFAFARWADAETFQFGLATPGIAGAAVDVLTLNAERTPFLAGPAADGTFLVGLGSRTRTVAELVVPDAPGDATDLGPLGCSVREQIADGARMGDGFASIASVLEPADDCEDSPDFDDEGPSAEHLRARAFGPDGSALGANDITTHGPVYDLAVIETSPPRIFWAADGVYTATLAGDATVGPHQQLDEGTKASSAGPWRDGFAVIEQHFEEPSAIVMRVYDADWTPHATTPEVPAYVVGSDSAFKFVRILSSPDGSSLLWAADTRIEVGGSDVHGMALFRAECR